MSEKLTGKGSVSEVKSKPKEKTARRETQVRPDKILYFLSSEDRVDFPPSPPRSIQGGTQASQPSERNCSIRAAPRSFFSEQS